MAWLGYPGPETLNSQPGLKSTPMRLRVRTLPDGEDHAVDLEDGATGFQLLKVLDRNPEAHLLLRGRNPIPMDTSLDDAEEISVVAIISGGVWPGGGTAWRSGRVAEPY